MVEPEIDDRVVNSKWIVSLAMVQPNRGLQRSTEILHPLLMFVMMSIAVSLASCTSQAIGLTFNLMESYILIVLNGRF
jgi:hypothetical protein